MPVKRTALSTALCVLRGCLAFCALMPLAACETGQAKPGPNGPDRVSGPLPAYATIAGAYNARVKRLEKLTAQVTVVIDAPNEGGGRINEQVEGSLQIKPPREIALRLDKVGQTLFYLGSNSDKYWWFDLSKERIAQVGVHSRVTPDAASRFGLLIHPLDLIELIGMTPLPPPGPSGLPKDAKLAWSRDGLAWQLDLPGRWGARRYLLDPKTGDPVQIELLDGKGRVNVSAAMGKYQRVEIRGDMTVYARLPEYYSIVVPHEDTRATLSLYGPTNPAERWKEGPFDLERLLSAYGIERIIDVDAAAAKTRTSSTPELQK